MSMKRILDYDGEVRITESGFIVLDHQDLATLLRESLRLISDEPYGQQHAGRMRFIVEVEEDK